MTSDNYGSHIAIAKGTTLLIFDIEADRVVVESTVSGNLPINKLQYTKSGDSLIVFTGWIHGRKTFKTLHLFETTFYTPISAPISAEVIEISDDLSKILIGKELDSAVYQVSIINLNKGDTILSYVESEKILNTVEVDELGNVHAFFKFKPIPKTLLEENLLNQKHPYINTGSHSGLYIQNSQILIIIKGITKLWDLDTRNPVMRFDTVGMSYELDEFDKVYLTKTDGFPNREWVWQQINSKIRDRYQNQQFFLIEDHVILDADSSLSAYDSEANYIGPVFLEGDISEGEIAKGILHASSKVQVINNKFVHYQDILKPYDLHSILELDTYDRLKDEANFKILNDKYAYSEEGNNLFFYNLESGNKVLTFTLIQRDKNLEWIWLDMRNGYFNFSNFSALDLVKWVTDEDQFNPKLFEIYLRDFYMPELAYKVLERDAKLDRPKLQSLKKPLPIVEIEKIREVRPGVIEVTVIGKSILHDSIESGLSGLRIFRDDILAAQWEWNEGNHLKQIDGTRAIRKKFRLLIPAKDSIKISAYALNADRTKSVTKDQLLISKMKIDKKSNLTLVSIGIGNNKEGEFRLSYSKSDALKVSHLFTSINFEDIDKVNTFELISGPASRLQSSKFYTSPTKFNIQWLLKSFSDSASQNYISPDDILVIFFSGHGFKNDKGEFFFVPYDFSREAREQSSLSIQELRTLLYPINSLNTYLIIDSCYSSAVIEDNYLFGPFGDPSFGQMSYDKGIPILSATQSSQTAQSAGGGLLVKLLYSVPQNNYSNLYTLFQQAILNFDKINKNVSIDLNQRPQLLYHNRYAPERPKIGQ